MDPKIKRKALVDFLSYGHTKRDRLMPNSRFSITGSKITASVSQPASDHKRQVSPIKTIVAKNFPAIPSVHSGSNDVAE